MALIALQDIMSDMWPVISIMLTICCYLHCNEIILCVHVIIQPHLPVSPAHSEQATARLSITAVEWPAQEIMEYGFNKYLSRIH